jgi:serine/threonine protein kinase|tara:strand:- start:10545 stop:12626 length:2082 start_codon:yes stop_codon:yes gene_type:complete
MSEEDKYDDEENEDSGEEDQQTGKYDEFGTYFGRGSQALSEFNNYFRKGNREADPKPNIYERLLGTGSVLDEIKRGDYGTSKGLEHYLPVEDELPPGTFHSDEGTETDVERELSEVPQVEFRAEFDEYEPVDTSARLPNEIHGSGLTKEQYQIIRDHRLELTGKVLGSGAYGRVFEIIDEAGYKSAVKVPDLNEKVEARRKDRNWNLVDIIREERLPADAGRNNIVQRLVFGDLIFMDLYAGSLDKFIPNAPATLPGKSSKVKKPLGESVKTMPLETVIKFSRDMTHALGYLHKRVPVRTRDGEWVMGKIHRDIKPDNFLYDSNGNLYLTDFGLSTESDNHGSADYSHDKIGKVSTKPYELCRNGATQSFQTDVWSMGAVIGKMLTGQYPLEDMLEDDDAKEKIGEMAEDEARERLNDYVRKAHPAFRQFLRDALAYNPERRIKDGAELENRFNEATKSYENSKPWNRVKRWGLAAAAAIGITAATNGGAFLAQRGDELEQKVADVEEDLELEKKLRVISRDIQTNSRFKGMSYQEYQDFGSLEGLINIFVDRETAYAAYIDPITTLKAIKTKDSQRYKDIKEYLYDNNLDILEIENLNSTSYFDPIEYDIYSKQRKTNSEKSRLNWETMEAEYEELEKLRTYVSDLRERHRERSKDNTQTVMDFKAYLSETDTEKYQRFQDLETKYNPKPKK